MYFFWRKINKYLYSILMTRHIVSTNFTPYKTSLIGMTLRAKITHCAQQTLVLHQLCWVHTVRSRHYYCISCVEFTLYAADTNTASVMLRTRCAQQTLVLHQLCHEFTLYAADTITASAMLRIQCLQQTLVLHQLCWVHTLRSRH